MRLRDWRKQNNKTLKECASALGLSNAGVFGKYEIGSHKLPAITVEAIKNLTDGKVTAEDMHKTRLDWELCQNHQEQANV